MILYWFGGSTRFLKFKGLLSTILLWLESKTCPLIDELWAYGAALQSAILLGCKAVLFKMFCCQMWLHFTWYWKLLVVYGKVMKRTQRIPCQTTTNASPLFDNQPGVSIQVF
ncbi:Heat shock 70 kDa protein [Lucilia cuprina]|nr:Heat shock 70 kDa protein [Lucilia cuprina]